MKRETRKNLLILFGVFALTTAGSYAWLATAGFNDENLRVSLRVTARAAFMLYLLVFVARPASELFPGRFTRWLHKERRGFGIAFASMHTAHLALIGCRFSSFPALEYPVSSAIVGGTAYLFILLMLLTSFDAPARAIGPTAWRRLHRTGLYVIGFVFVATLLPEPGEPLLTFQRAWFVVLTSGAIVLRLTAWIVIRRRNRAASA